MNKILLKIFAPIIAIILSTSALAQDPEFSQFYANPLYLNPAFAGSNNCPRVALNYRNQWPAISGSFVTQSVSYDQRLGYNKGAGIGLLVTNDVAAKTLSTLNASAIFSYHIPITRKFAIRVGFQATYFQKSLDWNKLSFSDQIDSRRGFVYTSKDVPNGNGKKTGVDFSGGILGFSERFYFGFAAHHVTEPNESLLLAESPLPLKLTGHVGAVIPLRKSRYKKTTAKISPNILYRNQGTSQQLNIGVYVNKGPIWTGVWYRNGDAFIVLLGIQTDLIRLGYSYDVTTSQLTLATAGSHEVSFAMNFSCKPPKRRYRTISCPSF
ncbi:type IX secretion system membrane protein PorP/SprF [Flavobacteriales bacterium]|nr:type IX secretion system membrane protein PorP/SprF [Flavobacteriales bacterium]